ncbi:hypothetical protein FB562_2194 [Homoserinimonas aerilata]|uniref:Uncharacterized protein n=1 Tax=Homoserinimonas aerilata TaxID=1162970 RepID=A0A542YF23_9MICO|nr:hypothetical protein [Homoserinimonas aerilata]TQL46670.1 hypothetical protein FB562_2194 [Homoserinimonas aerilata]
MVTAIEVGRDLHLTIGEVAPFIVRPLPARIGEQITSTYLEAAVGVAEPEAMTDAFRMAIDGGVKDPETGLFVPLAETEQHNYNRIQEELRTSEAESILLPAFLWQTVLGLTGVNAFIEGGEGVAGGVKALWALTARLGISPSRTSPSSALDDLIRLQAATPSTSSLPDGVKPGKQPRDRLPKQNKS